MRKRRLNCLGVMDLYNIHLRCKVFIGPNILQRKCHKSQRIMLKFICSKLIILRVIEDALFIHGHAGYCNEHPFQQMLRDVVAFEMIGGTEQYLKLLIAERMVGREAIPESIAQDILH